MDKNLSILVKFAALDKLTAPMRRMAGGAREAGRDLAATRREVLALQRSTAKIGAFKDLQRDAGKTAEKLGYARSRVEALRAAIAEAGGPTKTLAAQLLVAERAADRLEATSAGQATKLEQLSSGLREAGIDVGRLADEEGRLGKAIADANDRLDAQRETAAKTRAAEESRENISAMGDKLQAGGLKAVATGAAIAAPLFVGTKAAIEFEAAMADVKKVFNGTPAEFAALNAGVLELSKRVPVAAEGLAAIAAAGAQSGIEGPANLLKYAEAAAKMGVAFGITADQSGETMSAWRAGLGLTQEQVEVLADKVNYLGNVSGAKAPAIAEITKRIGPLGAVGGLASGEIAALAATLSSMGIEQEIAATGIKNTILTLTKGSAATKDQKNAFKQLGLESTKVAVSMQRDAAGTITDVMKRIARLPKAQQSGLLGELFGSESLGAIAPMLTQLPRLEENLRRVGDAGLYSGSMQQEFLGVTGTAASRLEQMSNKVDALKIGIGNRLLPVVASAADRIGNFVDRMDAFTTAHPRATKAVAVLAGAIALGLTVIGGLAIMIGTALGPLSFLVGALKTPAASATLLQRALQLMFVPLRGGVGLLARVGPMLMGLAGSFRFLLVPLTWVAGMLARLAPFFGIMGRLVAGLLSPIGMLGRLIMMAFTPISALLAPIGALLATITIPLWLIVAAAIAVGAVIYSRWSQIMTVTAPLRASLGALGSAMVALGSAFIGWLGRMAAPLTWVVGKIGEFVGPVALGAWKIFGDVVVGIISGISSALKVLVDWVVKGAGWLTRFFNASANAPAAPAPRAAAVSATMPAAPAPRAAAPAAMPKLAGKRAAGGPVSGGKLYLVGERGPELFHAPATGSIVPNHRMGRKLAMAGAAAMAPLPIAAEPIRIKPAAAAISAPAPAAAASRARGAAGLQITGPITIQVTAAPGQDPRAVGEAVVDALEQRAIAARAQAQSSYADTDE